MYTLIDGKGLAQKVRQELREELSKIIKDNPKPKLAVILIGDDSASKIYVRNKSRACEDVGIEFEEHILSSDIQMDELLELIKNLNNRKDITGILLQAPIPKHLSINKAFETIDVNKDVDGFNPVNAGNLLIGKDSFIPCTPLGIIRMLDEYNIDIQGKNAVVIGRSNIVGKPMAECLLNRNATITVCHSRTADLSQYTKNADILVSAVGKLNLVTKDMVKPGATVIDVGMNRKEDGKLAGDVDFENVKEVASAITPVPGGVGPMTIAMLMNNVIKAYKIQYNIK